MNDLCYNDLFVQDEGFCAVDNFNSTIGLLGNSEKQFVTFHPINESEGDFFFNLNVSQSLASHFYVTSENVTEFTNAYSLFFMSVGNNDIASNEAASIIERLVQDIFNSEINVDFMNIFASATSNNSKLNQHWHTDHYGEKLGYAVFFTLKGTGTLFCELSGDTAKRAEKIEIISNSHGNFNFTKIGKEGFFDQQHKLCNISDGDKVFQSQALFPVIAKTGDKSSSTVHSPAFLKEDEKRLAITIDIACKHG